MTKAGHGLMDVRARLRATGVPPTEGLASVDSVSAEVCDASDVRLDRRTCCRDGRFLCRRCGLECGRPGSALVRDRDYLSLAAVSAARGNAVSGLPIKTSLTLLMSLTSMPL